MWGQENGWLKPSKIYNPCSSIVIQQDLFDQSRAGARRSRSLQAKLFELDSLENQVGSGRFVKDAEGLAINHDEGAVGSSFCIEKNVSRPGFSIVQAHLDGHFLTLEFIIGVGEEKYMAAIRELVREQAGHANRFGEGPMV